MLWVSQASSPKDREMTQQQPPTEENPPRPPQYRVPRGLYYVAAGAMAMWVFVTFFFRNPYTQAISNDYYDNHPYDETSVWVFVLVIIPMIGLGAFLSWTRRKKSG
jgi:uncharacterized RDD family membrane protein YckC